MNSELISIIIPVYCVEQYLERCIESVLKQTYKNIEVIIVDDGSPDVCPQICDEFALKDERVIVIHQRNAGVSTARNIGIENANGKYIMFVDADDYLAPTLCENLLCGMRENVDLVTSGLIETFEKREVKHSVEAAVECSIEKLREEFEKYYYKIPVLNYPFAKLYKRKLMCDIRFDKNVSMGEDNLFNFEYIKKCKNIVILPVAEYYYDRTNENSATHTYKEAYFDCKKQRYIEIKKFIYGELIFRNDQIDEKFFSDIASSIRAVCYSKTNYQYKYYRIKLICDDALFQAVCNGKYLFPLTTSFLQELCRRKKYGLIIAFFEIRKLRDSMRKKWR